MLCASGVRQNLLFRESGCNNFFDDAAKEDPVCQSYRNNCPASGTMGVCGALSVLLTCDAYPRESGSMCDKCQMYGKTLSGPSLDLTISLSPLQGRTLLSKHKSRMPHVVVFTLNEVFTECSHLRIVSSGSSAVLVLVSTNQFR